jgi:hypothetical protein
MQNKKRYRIEFVVEQLWAQEVEASSEEEAFALFEEGHVDRPSHPTDWCEVQPDSYEVKEITDDN